jgi:hypothetical protein
MFCRCGGLRRASAETVLINMRRCGEQPSSVLGTEPPIEDQVTVVVPSPADVVGGRLRVRALLTLLWPSRTLPCGSEFADKGIEMSGGSVKGRL